MNPKTLQSLMIKLLNPKYRGGILFVDEV